MNLFFVRNCEGRWVGGWVGGCIVEVGAQLRCVCLSKLFRYFVFSVAFFVFRCVHEKAHSFFFCFR